MHDLFLEQFLPVLDILNIVLDASVFIRLALSIRMLDLLQAVEQVFGLGRVELRDSLFSPCRIRRKSVLAAFGVEDEI